MANEREILVEYGEKLISRQLTTGTGGNLSVFSREKRMFAITPSGMDYLCIKPEDIVVVRLDGEIVDGQKEPSSELRMHNLAYRRRGDINALVHVHSRYATTLSCLNRELPSVHYLVALAGKNVRCAPYARFGSDELALNAVAGMTDRKAVLLANHGLLAGGKDLPTAFGIAEQIEFCAEIYCRAKCIGQPVLISDSEMESVAEKLKWYGAGAQSD